MSCSLVEDIQKAYRRLVEVVDKIPVSKRQNKEMEAAGGRVSVADLIAYQIGWGTCLIRWYETGLRGESPEMPGEGFSKWDYVAIAKHFFQKYLYDASSQQMAVFEKVVFRILDIVRKEELNGHLDQEGVWSWCTLPSGKKWPLSKWVRVNTASPYKRAASLIKDRYV